MIKSVTEQNFEEYRRFLLNEAQRLTRYIDVYSLLRECKNDRLEEMNIAPAFFGTVIDALFSATILWTDKMFDEKSERGLGNFLKFCENNVRILAVKELRRRNNYSDNHWMISDRLDVSYQDTQNHRQKIEQMKCLPSIRLRRDKFHAHFDAKYFFDRRKISDEAPLFSDDFREVVDTMEEIINFYSTSYDGKIFSLRMKNIDDINNILDRLHNEDPMT